MPYKPLKDKMMYYFKSGMVLHGDTIKCLGTIDDNEKTVSVYETTTYPKRIKEAFGDDVEFIDKP